MEEQHKAASVGTTTDGTTTAGTTTIGEPRVPKVRCVACGLLIPHAEAYPVDYRLTTPVADHYRPVPLRFEDGWSYSYLTDVAARALAAGGARMRPWLDAEPQAVIHTYSGYACSRLHAEAGVAKLVRRLDRSDGQQQGERG